MRCERYGTKSAFEMRLLSPICRSITLRAAKISSFRSARSHSWRVLYGPTTIFVRYTPPCLPSASSTQGGRFDVDGPAADEAESAEVACAVGLAASREVVEIDSAT